MAMKANSRSTSTGNDKRLKRDDGFVSRTLGIKPRPVRRLYETTHIDDDVVVLSLCAGRLRPRRCDRHDNFMRDRLCRSADRYVDGRFGLLSEQPGGRAVAGERALSLDVCALSATAVASGVNHQSGRIEINRSSAAAASAAAAAAINHTHF